MLAEPRAGVFDMMCQITCQLAGHPHVNHSCVCPGLMVPCHCTPVHIGSLPRQLRKLNRPEKRTRSGVRFFTVIQYVVWPAVARSTATSHVSCLFPGQGVSGMMCQNT